MKNEVKAEIGVVWPYVAVIVFSLIIGIPCALILILTDAKEDDMAIIFLGAVIAGVILDLIIWWKPFYETVKSKAIFNKGIKTVGTINYVENTDKQWNGKKVVHITFFDENGISRRGKTYKLLLHNRSFFAGQEIGIEYIRNNEMILILKNFDIAAAKEEINRKAMELWQNTSQINAAGMGMMRNAEIWQSAGFPPNPNMQNFDPKKGQPLRTVVRTGPPNPDIKTGLPQNFDTKTGQPLRAEVAASHSEQNSD